MHLKNQKSKLLIKLPDLDWVRVKTIYAAPVFISISLFKGTRSQTKNCMITCTPSTAYL